jgi:hypothetical protein
MKMIKSTYAEGLREAARVCESEILPDHVDTPTDEMGWTLRRTATATMNLLATKFRRLADEADARASAS